MTHEQRTCLGFLAMAAGCFTLLTFTVCKNSFLKGNNQALTATELSFSFWLHLSVRGLEKTGRAQSLTD